MVKKTTKAKDDEKKVQQIQEALGFSHHDSEALLAHASQVQTTDILPLDEIKEYAKVDSTTTTLNNLHPDENPSAILDRDGPR